MERTPGCGATRRLAAALGVWWAALLLAPPTAGADGDDENQAHRPLGAHYVVRGNFDAAVRRQLTLASRLAQDGIRANAACSALFGRFGKDGLELFKIVEFEAAAIESTGTTCDRGGVPAFTGVGGRRIRLCPGFGLLSVPAAAVILIHELLHTAGMSEKPMDPNGLTPQEINRLVGTSCRR
ncbi:MAG: hypothetical protein PHQ91_05455 [Thermoanaerobaculaceae bacterium]|nr:hypothetical protein [Thermoanaerobaculaceae bacterium]